MVDVVVNHFGYNGAPDSVDYSTFTPFNSKSYFHDYCTIDYSNTGNAVSVIIKSLMHVDHASLECGEIFTWIVLTCAQTQITECWMGDTSVPLPDLRTEDSNVSSQYNTWISGLVSDYSVDGLRLDTVMEVNTGFWSAFHSAAGVYMVGEVNEGDAGYVCGFQNYVPGLLNYATYFPLVSAFSSTSGSISDLSNMINTVKGSCSDMSLLGSFSENHDQPRFASLTGDMALAKNVMTYTLLADGIPIVYQGQEQHYNALGGSNDPYNREAIWFSQYNTSAPLYELTKSLNAMRKQAISDDSSYLSYNNYPIYTDTTTLAMRKGKMVTVLSNKGASGASYTLTLASGYSSGTQVTELLTCDTLTTDGSGNLAVPMANGQPRIYYPSASIGSLCGGNSKPKPKFLVPRPKYVVKAKATNA